MSYNSESCLPSSERPDLSAAYLAEELRLQSFESRVPLTSFDIKVLKAPVMEVATVVNGHYLMDLNNRGVYLTRGLVERLKAEGYECMQIHFRLRVPYMLAAHCEFVMASGYSLVVGGIMQHSFFGNPGTNEIKPWRSPAGKLARYRGTFGDGRHEFR